MNSTYIYILYKIEKNKVYFSSNSFYYQFKNYWLNKLKVEIVEADNIRELDRLVNTCIQERHVTDIKLSSVLLQDGKMQYTALIMLES